MNTTIAMEAVAVVHNSRTDLSDDDWGTVSSRIELSETFSPEAFDGMEDFSHIEVVFHFNQVPEEKIERGARHPRSNLGWPRVGIFAQRGKNRPNRIGVTIARLLKREGRSLLVVGLDAIDGTPVLDVKPVMAEFLPREPVSQPAWSKELMRSYWVKEPNKSPEPTATPVTPPAAVPKDE